jgi:hypothetical protein
MIMHDADDAQKKKGTTKSNRGTTLGRYSGNRR